MMNSKKVLLVWRIWDQTQKLLPKFRASVLHLCSWVPEVAGGARPRWGAEEGEQCMVSAWSQHALMIRGPWPKKHSKMLWFPCSLTAQLWPVKSMSILQLISRAAATGRMVSSINCFSTHLILSTLAAWLKSMVQFRYLKWVMFFSILMNWSLNEHC